MVKFVPSWSVISLLDVTLILRELARKTSLVSGVLPGGRFSRAVACFTHETRLVPVVLSVLTRVTTRTKGLYGFQRK